MTTIFKTGDIVQSAVHGIGVVIRDDIDNLYSLQVQFPGRDTAGHYMPDGSLSPSLTKYSLTLVEHADNILVFRRAV